MLKIVVHKGISIKMNACIYSLRKYRYVLNVAGFLVDDRWSKEILHWVENCSQFRSPSHSLTHTMAYSH